MNAPSPVKRSRTFCTQVRILVREAKKLREVVHLYTDSDGNVGILSDGLRKLVERGEAPHVAALVSSFVLTCRPKRKS